MNAKWTGIDLDQSLSTLSTSSTWSTRQFPQSLRHREQLVRLIEAPDCNVLKPVEHMSGNSILREALLVIDHTAYHLGEFVLGRQVLGHWKSGLEEGAG